MNKILPILFFLAFASIVTAQKEANIWYFGHNAGLDFNNLPPTPLLDGELNTDEGCASIADSDGQLLFYTDGKFVWNKNHDQTPNGFGMFGHKSSTQSGVIVPKPGSTDIYYVFTVDFTAGSGGIAYSEVDMTLDGGLGDVSVKNIQLVTPACEKITAVLHENQQDIWVIGHAWQSDEFLAWLVTPNGVVTTPVVSAVGADVGGSNFNTIGYLKASAEGDKIAAAHWYDLNIVEIFDFDNSTGTLSNPITLSGYNGSGCYGVEFAPSEPILYVSERTYGGNLYQYDISSGNQATIEASRITLATYSGRWGAIQIGPDGKMYVSKRNSEYLGIINNPDQIGTGCDYVDEGIYLDGQLSWIGLPSFIQSYFVLAAFSFDGICFGLPTEFTLDVADTAIDSLIWNFGDPASGANNISFENEPFHTFTDSGTFEVTLIVFNQGFSDTSIQEIVIENPVVDLGADLTTCADVVNVLDATTPDATYLWNDNSTAPTFAVTEEGIYSVEITVNGCIGNDTIEVNHLPVPDLNLESDPAICENESYTFNATAPDVVTYLWSDNSTNPTLTTNVENTYTVVATNTDGCTASATSTLTVNALPVFDLGPDMTLCEEQEYLLSTGLGANTTYLWQNGTTDPTFTVTETGTYYVEATINNCTTIDSVDVDYIPIPDLVLDTAPTICEDETYTYDGTTPDVASYQWQNNSTDPVLTTAIPGTYTLTVTHINGCTTSEESVLTVNPLPVFSLGADTEVCEGDTYTLDVDLANGSSYLWQDGSTDPTFDVMEAGTYNVTITTLGCESEDEVVVVYTTYPEIDLGNDTLICEGEEVNLDAYYDDYTTYTWQNNSNLPTFDITEPGLYEVTLENVCGTFTDELLVEQNIPPLPVFIGNDTTICNGDSYVIDATNTNTTHYLWHTGSNEPTIEVDEPGYYAITWANNCGFITEYVEVESRSCECLVTLPNVFSPDGDGWNDKFNTVSQCDYFSYNLKVFSRWGELVFETSDPSMDAGWDGRLNGRDVSEGVYVYVVEYIHEFDAARITGDVTVMR